MTTLVALATKDALVMGCDSISTATAPLISLDSLTEYFENEGKWLLKFDGSGKPVLKDFGQIFAKAQQVPYTQMTHVTKLFSLKPLHMAVMITGISSIGQRTIKSLITDFKSDKSIFETINDYSVEDIGKKLLEYLNIEYCKVYPGLLKPELELIIGGYSKQGSIPAIKRIKVHENKIESTIDDFGIVFGGQMAEIQRIAFGTDVTNRLKIILRNFEIMGKYRNILNDILKANNVQFILPEPERYKDELNFFGNNWDLNRFSANLGDFSEQNAIECVDFFINIMIKSQQFSSSLPTVGGEVHIGLITKIKGFRFVSKEELSHAGHAIGLED